METNVVTGRQFCLRLSVIIALWAFAGDCSSAADFQNLDFEQAQIQPAPGPPPQSIDAAAALPSWTVHYSDNTPVTVIYLYPQEPLDYTFVSLIGPSYSPIQGSYSVELSAAFGPQPSSISQIGDVPATARSIKLLMRAYQGRPVITLNGTPINLLPPSDGSGSTITMVGDVTPFAGTTAELKISCATAGFQFPKDENIFALDSISFSTAIVAEPSTAILTVIAAPFLLLIRRMWGTVDGT